LGCAAASRTYLAAFLPVSLKNVAAVWLRFIPLRGEDVLSNEA